jgi:hypothetical protein
MCRYSFYSLGRKQANECRQTGRREEGELSAKIGDYMQKEHILTSWLMTKEDSFVTAHAATHMVNVPVQAALTALHH